MRILSLFLFSLLSGIAVSAQVLTTLDLSRHHCCGGDTTDDREPYRKPRIRTICKGFETMVYDAANVLRGEVKASHL